MSNILSGDIKKKIKVSTSVPIVNLPIPIIGTMDGISLTVDQIRECLRMTEFVWEYVGTSMLRLNVSNYNTDNSVVVEEAAKQQESVTKNTIATAQAAAQAALDAAEAKKEADAKTAQEATANTSQASSTANTQNTASTTSDAASTTKTAGQATTDTGKK